MCILLEGENSHNVGVILECKVFREKDSRVGETWGAGRGVDKGERKKEKALD